MNIRQLRYFCEVVTQGTLSRAAERLFVAPTAISMQISQLEAVVGGALFDRSVKPMALTALGQYLLPRARDLLAQAARLESDTREVALGRRGWLGVGFVRSTLFSVLPRAVRTFRRSHPDVKLELVELLSEHQTAALRQQRIHIGLSRHIGLIEPPKGLRQTLLFEDAFVAAVPLGHPAAGAGFVKASALAALPFVSFPKDPASSYASHVIAMLHAAGARPVVAHEAIEIHTALGLVAAGLGFAIVGASVAMRGPTDVAYVRLTDVDAHSTMVALTRDDDEGALTAPMLRTLVAIQPLPPVPKGLRGTRKRGRAAGG